MNEQEREEIAELILRALRLNYDVGLAQAGSETWVYDVIRMSNEAHAAQTEIWEALYRIRLDVPRDRNERTGSTDAHSAAEPGIRIVDLGRGRPDDDPSLIKRTPPTPL